MLAPEHPSPWQNSQVYVPLLVLWGSNSFSQKRTFRNTRKVGPMSHACGPCGSKETTANQNLLLGKRVPSWACDASLLKHRHCKRARSDARQDRPPSSEPCRFRAASHQCRSSRCFRLRKQLQELVRLIRPPLPREPPNARVHLLQTTLGNFVPSSGEQPSMKTHPVTLHLFWLCHPFSGDKPESCRSQIMRLQRGTIRPPRLPEGVRPSL